MHSLERFIVHVGIGRHGMRVSRGLTSVTDERQRGSRSDTPFKDDERRDATRRDVPAPGRIFCRESRGRETSPLPICMNLITEFSFCHERETFMAVQRCIACKITRRFNRRYWRGKRRRVLVALMSNHQYVIIKILKFNIRICWLQNSLK